MATVDNRASLPEPALVIRFVAALMFFAWTACYAHCAAELVSASVGQVDECCQHDQAPATDPSTSGSLPCGICDAIVAGGLLLSQPVLLITLLLAALAGLLSMSSGFWTWLRVALGLRSPLPQHIPDPPWLMPRLSELLARTTCPVRGPNGALA